MKALLGSYFTHPNPCKLFPALKIVGDIHATWKCSVAQWLPIIFLTYLEPLKQCAVYTMFILYADSFQ